MNFIQCTCTSIAFSNIATWLLKWSYTQNYPFAALQKLSTEENDLKNGILYFYDNCT